MSVTIEDIFVETLKTFVDDPLKTPFKSPVLLKGYLKKLKRLLHDPDKLQSKSPVIMEEDDFLLLNTPSK